MSSTISDILRNRKDIVIYSISDLLATYHAEDALGSVLFHELRSILFILKGVKI